MSTAEVADPSATLMVFFMFGCFGFIAINIGVPHLWVLNGMVSIMAFGFIFFTIRALKE